jgi:replicative DNA helicase
MTTQLQTQSLGPIPPQDQSAEQCILGAMLLSKECIADITEILQGKDFYRPAHEIIYDTILDLNGKGEPVDAVLVSDELLKNKTLTRIGGVSYLHTLISSVPSTANATYYARIVADKAKLRRLMNAGERITKLGMAEHGGDIDDLQQAAHGELNAATDTGHTTDWASIGSGLENTWDIIEANGNKGKGITGIATGLDELDTLTGGLQPGQMIVIAARPGVGKSTLGLDIARNAAITQRAPTAFFSLEMNRDELNMRAMSAEATLSLQAIRTGKLSTHDWTKLAKIFPNLTEAPLYIDDSPNLNMTQIRSKCRRIKQKHDLKLVVIDYLQLMTTGKRTESRQQEVSEISRNIKVLAKELGIPIIAISQLNRESEHRSDKKPAISDMRESGSIEQDADIIILLHREELGNKETPRAGEADLIIAKHRNGPTATIETRFQGHYSRFINAYPTHTRAA